MLALMLLLPFAVAVLLPFSGRLGLRLPAWLAGAVCAGLLGWLVWHAPWPGLDISYSHRWLPALGLRFSLSLDGLGYLFGLLIAAIGLLVVVYARYYLSRADSLPRFYSYLLLFMGAMLGVVWSDNLLLLMVFWELTSLSSFLLIGFWHEGRQARIGARMALTVTGAGGLAMFAGFLLLGDIVGSFDLHAVIAARAQIQADPWFPLALGLILLGAFTKSAQFPFHFWLPQAMAAPTPVSAYLHSATMVKAGVFLLARLYPALGGNDWWFSMVAPVGLATLLVGAYCALYRDDLKGLLAYSTISHLGLITLLFGLDTPEAAIAGVFHIINHAIFKAGLFMTAGIIDHETGTRDMRVLRGLYRFMPVTTVLGTVAAASMAGVPLLNGFLSKEMFYAQALAAQPLGTTWLLPALAWLATALSVAYSVRFVHLVFFARPVAELPRVPHEPPRWMRIPVELLVLLCVAVGMAPQYTVDTLLRLALPSVIGETIPSFELAIWHGWTTPLAMSMAALVVGLLIYRFMHPLGMFERRMPVHLGSRTFATAMDELIRLARWLTQLSTDEQLRPLLRWIVVLTLLAGLLPWWAYDAPRRLPDWAGWPDDPGLIGLTLMMTVAGLLTVWLRHRRLLAMLMLAVVGLTVVLSFVQFASPDLALTQLAVEIASTVLLLLALRWLPVPTDAQPEPWWPRLRDAVLALIAGAGVFLVLYSVLQSPQDSLSGFYLEHALPLGGGANVVNVILVDFRGFDTLGEITVLAIAGLLLVKLLDDYAAVPQPAKPDSLLLATMARLILPFALLMSAYLYLRGHQAPGGGFVAGLVTAAGLLVQHIAYGSGWAARHMPVSGRRLSALGLLVAVGTGLGSWLFDKNFLTSGHGHLDLGWLGELEWASAALFDLGVYLVVVGATMAMLTRLAATQDPQEGHH
ncbi:monovalent cation/H+ antiporter subunit A [Chitinivorax sp. B]|uniref:monovalent cation/H+ antiporter subunit A n=1 Tax=Chitinivorax sp. B TaxID=2502235 RepID=UPI0010F7D219|nr:monovalent cation/H+ antiporter subunit A [Chitinivorax sp. B]